MPVTRFMLSVSTYAAGEEQGERNRWTNLSPCSNDRSFLGTSVSCLSGTIVSSMRSTSSPSPYSYNFAAPNCVHNQR